MLPRIHPDRMQIAFDDHCAPASSLFYWNRAWPVRLPLPISPCVNARAHRFGGFGLNGLADDSGAAVVVVGQVDIPLVASSFVQYQRVGAGLVPERPLRMSNRDEVQVYALQRPFDSPAQKLAPQCSRLMVIHDQGVHDQLARHAKGVLDPVDLAGIHDARETERSPRHRDRHASDNVVDDLVPAQHLDGIRPALAADGQA